MIVNPVVYGGGGKEPVIESLSSSQISISPRTITLKASQNIETLLGFSVSLYYYSVIFSYPGEKSISGTFTIFCFFQGDVSKLPYEVSGDTITFENLAPEIDSSMLNFASISYIPL